MNPDPVYRQSLYLPEDVWEWLETEAARRGCTRSDIATETFRAAMTEGDLQ